MQQHEHNFALTLNEWREIIGLLLTGHHKVALTLNYVRKIIGIFLLSGHHQLLKPAALPVPQSGCWHVLCLQVAELAMLLRDIRVFAFGRQ